MTVEHLTDRAFRAIVEAAPDAILLVDGQGRIAYLNEQGESLFGFRRDDLIGQRIEVLVPEQYRSMHQIHREVYEERPESRPMGIGLDLAGRRRDGTTFPVEISLSTFHDGELRYSVAVIRDVTRQHRVEETLRRSEERHRLLNERASNIVFRFQLQPAAAFEYVSAAVHGQLGYAPEDFYIDPVLITRITHEPDRELLREILSASPPAESALRLQTRHGEVRWFEFSVTPVRNADGTVTALEGNARDVTERRHAEEEQHRLQSQVDLQLERNRIAGDLHDDIIQSLYALGLGLHAVRDDPSVTREASIDSAIEGLNGVMTALRTYMHRLSGDDDEDESLDSLGGRIAALIGPGDSPRWTVEVDPDLALDRTTERHLFLLAKELISNVQRHAHARVAGLHLGRTEAGELVLVVEDDGIGFDRTAVGEGSFGLRSVALRASTLGATLSVESSRDGEEARRGSCIRVTMPAPIQPQ